MNDSRQTKEHAHLGYLLTAYLFKSLSAPGVREVETHLKRCAQCRAELETLRHTLGLIEQSFDSDDKKYVFEERRRARVLEAARQPRPVLQMPVWSKFALASVAAILMCGVLLFSMMARLSGSRMAANETAASASAKTFAEAEEIYHRSDYTGNGALKYAPPPASAPPPSQIPNGQGWVDSSGYDNPPPRVATEIPPKSKEIDEASSRPTHPNDDGGAYYRPGTNPGFTNGPTESAGKELAEKKKKVERNTVRDSELEYEKKLADVAKKQQHAVVVDELNAESNERKNDPGAGNWFLPKTDARSRATGGNGYPSQFPLPPPPPPAPAATPVKDSVKGLVSGGTVELKDLDRESSDVQVPPDVLAKVRLGDHFETIDPDKPDTHSALGNPDSHSFHNVEGNVEAAGGGGMGGLAADDLVGVGGAASKGTGGGSFGERSAGGKKLMVKRHGEKEAPSDPKKDSKRPLTEDIDEIDMKVATADGPAEPAKPHAVDSKMTLGYAMEVSPADKDSAQQDKFVINGNGTIFQPDQGVVTGREQEFPLVPSGKDTPDSEKFGTFDREKVGSLGNFQVRTLPENSDPADKLTVPRFYPSNGDLEGTFYSRGQIETIAGITLDKSESEESKKLFSKNFTLSQTEIFNRDQWAQTQHLLPAPVEAPAQPNSTYDPNFVPRYYVLNGGDPVLAFVYRQNGEAGGRYWDDSSKAFKGDEASKPFRIDGLMYTNNAIFGIQGKRSLALPDSFTERLLRGYHYFKAQNPALAFRDYASRPSPVPAPTLTDDGLNEDDYIERYGTRPFVDCARDHFSTFGLDVDTASYALTRSRLRQGQLPEPDAVRVEEFLNYFKQPYSVCGEDAFGVFAEGAPSAFSNVDILKIGIKSRDPRPDERKPAMLTFCVDTSGSMTRDDRLELCRKALTDLVMTLNPEDTVSIVGFSEQAELILPRTQAKQKQRILDAIENLSSHGSTNVEAGLNMAYRMADESFSADAVNRVILCSDGVANIGAKGPDEMLKLVKIFSSRGIELSTVGFGMGQYNDKMMVRLADNGNGSCHFVDSLAEAKKVFSEQLPPHLNVLARDAKAQVDFNPAVVERYRLLGYEKRKIADKDFRNDAIDSGDVAHSTLITVIYELTRKPAAHGDFGKIYLRWKDAGYRHLPVVERNYPLSEGVMASDVQKSSPQFRFLLCVARFAELLRDSPWVRDSSYASVLDELHRLPAEFQARGDCREILELVQLAQRLSVEKWSKELGR